MTQLSPPIKTVYPFFAQAANHPLPTDLAYADGSSVNDHGISGGVTPYVLPNLINRFIIGADRTQTVGHSGSYISFVSSMTTNANAYNYQIIDYNDYAYVVQSGDYFTYDVYWPSANIPGSGGGCGAADIYFSDGTLLRTLAPNDQNGLSSHPNTDLRTYALNQWYTRHISLTSYVGKTITGIMLAHEYDTTFANLTTRFQNLGVTNTAHDTWQFVAWQGGDGTPTYTTHAINSATFVSGNDLTLTAPGPNGVSGTSQRQMRTRHIPSHNHTGSTSSAGSHAHVTSINGHASHTHSSASGGAIIISDGTSTFGHAGSTFYQVTCTMATIAAAGAHSHSVSPANAGAHTHNIFATTVSGANATAMDMRPRSYATVWCLKKGGSKVSISPPMGTIIMWYADTQNETLPTGMSYCDGSTLTSGNHSVPNQSGSLSYSLVLPDLRNRYLIGADRTKNVGAVGSSIDGPGGAPGPQNTSGVHSFTLALTNLINHSHTASTDTQWSTHNHNWTISTNANHTHAGAASFITSTNQALISISGTGSISNDYFATSFTSLNANGAHSHVCTISTAGGHDHTITINSTGSGTSFDNRPPAIGIIYLMKTTVGPLPMPLKTIVGIRVDVTNETAVPSDGTWAVCDGSTLTPGNFDMTANSGGNYVLPDFRKFFPIGADRTKVVGNTGGLTDTAADAPGPKGSVGAATVTISSSNMPSHAHAGSTDGVSQGAHNHNSGLSTDVQGSHTHGTGCHASYPVTDGVQRTNGSSGSTSGTLFVSTWSGSTGSGTHPAHSFDGDTQGAHTHAVTVNNFGAGGAMHQRPRHHGLVFYMKVKR